MTEQEQQMMQQQMQQQQMQQQGQQGAPSQEEQMMMQQQMQQQQSPQQGGQDEAMQKIMQFVQQAISQGMEPLEVAQLLLSKEVPPEIIMQVFVQIGLPEQDAQIVIQQAMASAEEGVDPNQQPMEDGAPMPPQEGQPMPPEGQPGEQPMPPQGQPPMGYGGMMYADDGMAVNNDELNTVMSQVQEMLAQPNADIRVIMQEIQKAAEAGQITPETATTVLEALQQNMPNEEEMYAQEQMQQQAETSLAKFGGNLRKLLSKAAGGTADNNLYPDEDLPKNNTNDYLNAVKQSFFDSTINNNLEEIGNNNYAAGGEPCPECPDGTIVNRLPDNTCPCQTINEDISSIDAMLSNNNNPNTVLTPPLNNPNVQALNDILDHNFNFNLDYGPRNRLTADINNKGQGNFNYKLLPSKRGFYGGLGAGVDLNKNTNYTTYNAGYKIPNVLGSTLDINGNVKMEDQNPVAAFYAGLENEKGFGLKTNYSTDGSWGAGVSYDRDGTKTTPAVKIGLNYTGSTGSNDPQNHENGGLVKAVDGISMKDGKLIVNPQAYKNADAFEVAVMKWNLDAKNKKNQVNFSDWKWEPAGKIVFGEYDAPVKQHVDGQYYANPERYKSEKEYKDAMNRYNDLHSNSSEKINLDIQAPFIEVPDGKKKVAPDPKGTYKYDEATGKFVQDFGTAVGGYTQDQWNSMSPEVRTIATTNYKTIEDFKKAIAAASSNGSQPVGYNNPNAQFTNPWARLLFGNNTGGNWSGPTTTGTNLPPGFNIDEELRKGMSGVTPDGVAWKITSKEAFKENQRVPGLFNNIKRRGTKYNIEWGTPNKAGTDVLKKDITKDSEVKALDPVTIKDKDGNIIHTSNVVPGTTEQELNQDNKLVDKYDGMKNQVFTINPKVNPNYVEPVVVKSEDIKKKSYNINDVKIPKNVKEMNQLQNDIFDGIYGTEDKNNDGFYDSEDYFTNNIIKEYNKQTGENYEYDGSIPDERDVYRTESDLKDLKIPSTMSRDEFEVLYKSITDETMPYFESEMFDRYKKATGRDYVEETNSPTNESIANMKQIRLSNRELRQKEQVDSENKKQATVNPEVIIPTGQDPYLNSYADPIPYGPENMPQGYVNPATSWDEPIPNNFYRQTTQGRGIGPRGELITDPNYAPVYEEEPVYQPPVYQEPVYQEPVYQDPNIPIGYAEKPFAFDNIQPNLVKRLSELKLPARFRSGGQPYGHGGRLFSYLEEGGPPPCSANEEIVKGVCRQKCADGQTRDSSGNCINTSFTNMMQKQTFGNDYKKYVEAEKEKEMKRLANNENLNRIKTGSSFENTTEQELNQAFQFSDLIDKYGPTEDEFDATNNSDNKQGTILTEEEYYKQRGNKMEDLADGLFGSTNWWTDMINKKKAMNPEQENANLSSVNIASQGFMKKGAYDAAGRFMPDEINNTILNPTAWQPNYDNRFHASGVPPSVHFSNQGGNIFEYGGQYFDIGGTFNLSDKDIALLRKAGFNFQAV